MLEKFCLDFGINPNEATIKTASIGLPLFFNKEEYAKAKNLIDSGFFASQIVQSEELSIKIKELIFLLESEPFKIKEFLEKYERVLELFDNIQNNIHKNINALREEKMKLIENIHILKKMAFSPEDKLLKRLKGELEIKSNQIKENYSFISLFRKMELLFKKNFNLLSLFNKSK